MSRLGEVMEALGVLLLALLGGYQKRRAVKREVVNGGR